MEEQQEQQGQQESFFATIRALSASALAAEEDDASDALAAARTTIQNAASRGLWTAIIPFNKTVIQTLRGEGFDLTGIRNSANFTVRWYPLATGNEVLVRERK